MLGLFTAVSPRILSEVLGVTSPAVAGVVVFGLLGSSTAAQLVLRRAPAEPALAVGCVLLAAGTGLVGAATAFAALPALVAGAVVAGIGQGMTFSRGLAAVTEKGDPATRAGITSSYFVVVYVAISLPVVGVGAASQAWGLVTAAVVFSGGVAVLAALALASLLLRRVPG